ncbi:hypothetical protein NA57DRAFT_53142 [Rhizodiscina lignyota]|uniref:Uncharacterized protein n=1 Tax=Rhizodiscina lignyota TaxID=1504668 RepID=A0A9P4IJK0_9PEZI|nr:hypothetical protein NA57DRAFT_53142 [Rhizodiscina lignyota]
MHAVPWGQPLLASQLLLILRSRAVLLAARRRMQTVARKRLYSALLTARPCRPACLPEDHYRYRKEKEEKEKSPLILAFRLCGAESVRIEVWPLYCLHAEMSAGLARRLELKAPEKQDSGEEWNVQAFFAHHQRHALLRTHTRRMISSPHLTSPPGPVPEHTALSLRKSSTRAATSNPASAARRAIKAKLLQRDIGLQPCLCPTMPDLNSLPPSRSPSTSRILSSANNGPPASPPSPSSHSPHSLAATAALNAGARSTERRRSSARMNINLSDSGAFSGPGEGGMSPGLRASPGSISGFEGLGRHGRMADRERAPSLGELHQELESEQEGQVLQLSQTPSNTQSQAVDDSTPTSERSMSISQAPAQPPISAQPSAVVPSSNLPRSRSPFHPHSSLSRQSSYRSSRNNSPLIRPTSGTHESTGSTDFTLGQPARDRDDAAFYAAETQSLSRENAMLRQRIRELERQLNEANTVSAAASTAASAAQSPTATMGRDGQSEGGGPTIVATSSGEEVKED